MGRQPSSGVSPSPSSDSPPPRWRSVETEGARNSPRGDRERERERERNGEGEEGGRIKSNLYKTELCRSFEETGGCNYGAKCQFAHGAHELRSTNKHPRYKTEICKTFHTIGTCPYGKRCRFIHMEGIPQVWMPTNPLNYLILHEDRGPYELTPEISLDTFLKILEATKTPDLAPEMAYIAKLVANNHQAPTQSDLVNIHQRVLSGYPKGHRLPVFAKNVSLV